jgi:hypothetical protein
MSDIFGRDKDATTDTPEPSLEEIKADLVAKRDDMFANLHALFTRVCSRSACQNILTEELRDTAKLNLYKPVYCSPECEKHDAIRRIVFSAQDYHDLVRRIDDEVIPLIAEDLPIPEKKD